MAHRVSPPQRLSTLERRVSIDRLIHCAAKMSESTKSIADSIGIGGTRGSTAASVARPGTPPGCCAGTSRAVALGAYAFALAEFDRRR